MGRVDLERMKDNCITRGQATLTIKGSKEELDGEVF